MTYKQTDTVENATTFPTIIEARDTGILAANKWQLHFRICNAESGKGYVIRLANGQWLKVIP